MGLSSCELLGFSLARKFKTQQTFTQTARQLPGQQEIHSTVIRTSNSSSVNETHCACNGLEKVISAGPVTRNGAFSPSSNLASSLTIMKLNHFNTICFEYTSSWTVFFITFFFKSSQTNNLQPIKYFLLHTIVLNLLCASDKTRGKSELGFPTYKISYILQKIFKG